MDVVKLECLRNKNKQISLMLKQYIVSDIENLSTVIKSNVDVSIATMTRSPRPVYYQYLKEASFLIDKVME